MTRDAASTGSSGATRAPDDFGALLATLLHAEVEFVVVGPVAARARGVNLADLDTLGAVLDIAPSPQPANLARLAQALGTCGTKLRCDEQAAGLPITLHAETFADIPVLPLTTELGDLDVVLRGPGSPVGYDELVEDATLVHLDGIRTLVPTIETLLRGVAGGYRPVHEKVFERLHTAHEAVAVAQLTATGVPARPDAIGDDDATVQRVILEVLGKLDRPASVRDLLFALSGWKRLPYKKVKAAAEALTVRGQLLREKDGTAHRYSRNADPTDRLAHEVAALLAEVPEPEAVVRLALEQLGRAAR